MSGRLPVLEGFALPGDHPLNRYQRAYLPICRAGELDCVGRIGGAGEHEGDGMVRGFNSIALGIPTADFEWPARIRSSGPVNRSTGERPRVRPVRAGVRVRRFSGDRSADGGQAAGNCGQGVAERETAEPTISAPMPQLPETGRTFSSSLEQGLSSRQLADSKNSLKPSDQPASRLAGRGCEFGGSAQEPGASEESGGDKENQELRWLRLPV